MSTDKIKTLEDFQGAKVEDREALLRMPHEEAQRFASPIPENARLRVISNPLPEDMLEALLNGRKII
jgi:hypothetical protein